MQIPRASRRTGSFGFTLLELLVVLMIFGIMLGMVTMKILPSDRQRLEEEARRIATLLQTAREEAIVRNRLVAFEATAERYRFLLRDNNRWQALPADDLLRERVFSVAPVSLNIEPPALEGGAALRITFGREPVDKPFVLTISTGEYSVQIKADGIGHFNVE